LETVGLESAQLFLFSARIKFHHTNLPGAGLRDTILYIATVKLRLYMICTQNAIQTTEQPEAQV